MVERWGNHWEVRGERHRSKAVGKGEAELTEVLSALERAIGILTSEMAKSGASM